MKLVFAIIAGILAVAGNLPYLRDVIKNRIQPHPYTWLVWSIVSGVTFVGQVVEGAGYAAIAFGASEIFTVIIFVVSLKNGFKNIPKQDSYFLAAALLGIIPWIILNDPTWSVVIMVTIDLIAFIPTLKKAWYKPKTENPILYGSNVLRHALALLALSSYNIATMLHSIAMIITNIVMTMFVLRRKVFKTTSIFKGYTTKADGPMREKENRVRFLMNNKMGHKIDLVLNQVHGNTIVTADDFQQSPKADGIITSNPRYALFILVADCLPILFHDPKKNVVAAAHAGREGTVQEISKKMVEKFINEYHSKPEDIIVELGPSIGVCCYEVSQEMADSFKEKLSEAFVEGRNINLPLINKKQLLEAGVSEENISISDICTQCSGDDYFSYRNGDTNNRFAGVIALM